MKATIKQAEMNEKNLIISTLGNGHFKISCDFRNKTISTITTNTMAVDNFKSEFGEKVDGCNKRKQGYESLINEIILNN